MRILSLGAIAVAIVLFVSWLSIVFYPSAQDFMRANPFWNGLRDFSGRFGVEMVSSLEEAAPRPGGSVLIIIPYLPYQDDELRRIADFVRAGGTLLIMDDYGYGNQILEALGLEMEFDGDPLLDPYLCYRNQWLPLVTDLAPQLKEAGIEQLILNHATALRVSGPYEVLARSSDTAFLDSNGNELWDEGEARGPLAVAARAAVGRGTVIAVSDPSILINSMAGRGDNSAFLRHLILAAGESPRVALDTSHLPKAPLDRSQDSWEMARERMSSPYSQVLLVGVILALTMMPVWRKGAQVEQER
ncbi:MAG: DUF4350 domain-containing protein [Chloroflexota bacterium]|nr:DUF4350 domain-containing protein [Chloroflexota bacterium]